MSTQEHSEAAQSVQLVGYSELADYSNFPPSDAVISVDSATPVHTETSAAPVLPKTLAKGLGDLALGGVVWLEVNPFTNEIPRLGLAAATQAHFNNPLLTAAAYAASTLLVEGGGVLATAQLLDTDIGHRFTQGANGLLRRFKLDGLLHTNSVADMGVALLAGAPAAVLLKHRQEPERSRAENIRYGTILALGTTAIVGAQGFLAAEGVTHADSLPLAVGVVAASLGVLWGIRKWTTERLAKPQPHTYEEYREFIEDDGPQIRGYQAADYEQVLKSRKTKFLSINDGETTKSWPILADIRLNTEYASEYFEERYGKAKTYYLSLPPRHLLTAENEAEIAKAIVKLTRKGAHIVFDERAGIEDTRDYLQQLVQAYHPKVALSIDEFVDTRNNTPAEVAHFSGLVTVEDRQEAGEPIKENVIGALRNEYRRQTDSAEQHDASSRSVVIDPQDLDSKLANGQTVLERLGEIYGDRFTDLTAQYPVRGAQKSEELETLLRKPTTLVLGQLEGDTIAAFTYISDVKDCEWLNAQHFENAYPEEVALYFPGIAADKKYEGRNSMGMMHLLGKLVQKHLDKVRIVFQCTNISKAYIPRLVKLGIRSARGLSLNQEISNTASYHYYGIGLAAQK